jgi:hypothetical protein
VARRVGVIALCTVAALAGGCRHDTGLRPMGAGPAPSVTLATSADGVPAPGTRGTMPATARPSPTPPRRTAARQAPPPQPPATGPLVQYNRMGGIAGFNDELVIQRDGTYRISRREVVVARGRLSGAELDRLRSVLEASHFSGIPAVSLRGGADLMTYVVAYQGRVVTAMDGAVPRALGPVLGVLDDLLARHAG